MYYNKIYNEEGINYIEIPKLKSFEIPEWSAGEIIDELEDDEYYYELTLICDFKGFFDHAEICKVGGAEDEDVHGSEYYVELNSDELEQIVEFIIKLFDLKTWSASATLFGEDETKYLDIDLYITNDLYNKIQAWVDSGKLLEKADFYSELCGLIDESVEDYLKEEALKSDDFAPERDNYYTDEEYDEALGEYNSIIENYVDSYSLENYTIFDPNEEKKFINQLKGRKLKEFNKEELEIKYEFKGLDDECTQKYSFKVKVDLEGYIIEVFDIYGVGLAYETVRSSSYESCPFDYDFVLDEMEKYLE